MAAGWLEGENNNKHGRTSNKLSGVSHKSTGNKPSPSGDDDDDGKRRRKRKRSVVLVVVAFGSVAARCGTILCLQDIKCRC